MGRPLAGFGFFNAEKRFDAETENFEKIKIHAFLEQDAEPAVWAANTQYEVGDKVKNSSTYYICKTANSQSTFLAVETAPAAWAASTQYNVGDKVTNSSAYYICKTQHTSSDAFATDAANWESYTLVTYWESYTLGGGSVEDAKIIKQTGYNKYLVSAVADENRQGIVMLVNGSAEATVSGTGYIVVTDVNDGKTTHNVRKMVRNIIETFDDKVYTYEYVVTENDGELSGEFQKTNIDCYPEVIASNTNSVETLSAPVTKTTKNSTKAKTTSSK